MPPITHWEPAYHNLELYSYLHSRVCVRSWKWSIQSRSYNKWSVCKAQAWNSCAGKSDTLIINECVQPRSAPLPASTSRRFFVPHMPWQQFHDTCWKMWNTLGWETSELQVYKQIQQFIVTPEFNLQITTHTSNTHWSPSLGLHVCNCSDTTCVIDIECYSILFYCFS